MNRVFGKVLDNHHGKNVVGNFDKENAVNQCVRPKIKSVKRHNPQSVLEHQDEIQQYLLSLDKPMTDRLICDVDRQIVIKTIFNAQRELMLLEQTCFMAIDLFDRCPDDKRKMLEIYVFTCLHIACKYEEIYPPNLVMIAMYGKLDSGLIIETEFRILSYLDFKIISNNTIVFIDFILHKISERGTPLVKRLAYYIAEATLLKKETQEFKRAHLATAILMVVEEMLTVQRADFNWSNWKRIPLNDPAIKVIAAILSDKSKTKFIRDRYKF